MKIVLPKLFASCILKYCQLYCKISFQLTRKWQISTTFKRHRTNVQPVENSETVRFAGIQSCFVASRFDTNSKQWNCTKISITSRKVCSWKTFWVNILRSLSQVREPIYTSKTLKELTCIETTGNRKFERIGLAFTRNHLNRTRM